MILHLRNKMKSSKRSSRTRSNHTEKKKKKQKWCSVTPREIDDHRSRGMHRKHMLRHRMMLYPTNRLHLRRHLSSRMPICGDKQPMKR